MKKETLAQQVQHMQGLHSALRMEFDLMCKRVEGHLQGAKGREEMLAAFRKEFDELHNRFMAHMIEEEMEVNTLTRIEDNLAENTKNTNEMYQLFLQAAYGFQVIGKLGRWIARGIHWLSENYKALILVAVLAAMGWSWLTTGHLEVPPWIAKALG